MELPRVPTATTDVLSGRSRICPPTIKSQMRPRHGVSRGSRPCRIARASQEDAQVEELLKAADALMSQLGSPEAQSAAAANPTQEDTAPGRGRIMKLVCDESSCVIVPVAADSSSYGPPGSFIGSSGQLVAEGNQNQPRDFLLSEGEGWKLGFDRDPVNPAAYTALVASDSWSVSMTKQEFTDFVQLLRKLQRSIATLQTCGEWGPENGGSNKEAPSTLESSLEMQTDRIWMQARAPQKQLFNLTKLFRKGVRKRGQEQQAAFHLRFIVNAPKNQPQREFEGNFSAEVVMRLLEHLETYPAPMEALDNPEHTSEGARTSAVAGYIG